LPYLCPYVLEISPHVLELGMHVLELAVHLAVHPIYLVIEVIDSVVGPVHSHRLHAIHANEAPRTGSAPNVKSFADFCLECVSAGADPGATAGVSPDFGGDAVLFGLRRVLGGALAAVEIPGRGEDLVGAPGAAARVDGAVVAAGLAHHDVGGDRVGAAEPAAD